jgi:cyclopropane-fatty-acyl-phospholipid synthase
MDAKGILHNLIRPAGVEFNGARPFDIHVHDPRFYGRVLRHRTLGLGESYMEGWWDCDDLPELFYRIATSGLDSRLSRSTAMVLAGIKAQLLNLQSRRRSATVAERHYNISTDMYRSMSDRWITLSCGYWRHASTLDEAQEAKLDLIVRKLRLTARDRILDIGCGFGAFARFAAERYGCTVVGVNVSAEQVRWARNLSAGLAVEFHVNDYRELDGYWDGRPFDAVVSSGMFEHVGHKNHRIYMQVVDRVLKPNGLFLLHTIGSNVSSTTNDPWFDRYIFPNGLLPSVRHIGAAIEGLFVMEDWHNFGRDYEKTLLAWYTNFDRAWAGDRADPLFRMWRYYLLSAAGVFRSRTKQLWQIVLAKGGVPGGYVAVR